MNLISTIFLLMMIGCSSPKVLQKSGKMTIDRDLLSQIQITHLKKGRSIASLNAEASTKRSYFKEVYDQYLLLSQITSSANSVKSCPAFHTDFIDFSPTTVLVRSSQQQFKDALIEIEIELKSLCQKGVSSDYYKFENLINYHVNRISFHQNPESFFSLYKILPFKNIYHLDIDVSISTNYSIIKASEMFWFVDYINKIKHSKISKLGSR